MTDYDLIERIVHLEDELNRLGTVDVLRIVSLLVSALSVIVCVICTFVTIHYSKTDSY